MKNEVYQQVKELVTQYGKIDDIWWDGGWLGQQGSDADAAFFWEPGMFRDTSNEWPVDAPYSDTDPATGKPLGLTGLVRKHQPDGVTTLRAGWIGDFASEEGPSVPSGAIRTGKVSEKTFTIGGAWGYKAGSGVMGFGNAMNILVNAWVRNMTCLLNVGPDRTGAVPSAQQSLVRQTGSFLSTYGEAVYGTRGGPWNPVDGKYGYTYKDKTFYVHLLPGYSGTSFTTPQIGDGTVTRVFDVASGADLSFSVDDSGKVTITGINRTRIPEDGRTATASSEESSKGNTAAKALDGSTATRWCANNGNTGNWLKVDLGATKSLTGARIAWELDATNYRYRIEGSTDNSNWTMLADRTGTTSTSQVQVAVFSASARYVRVTVTGLPSGAWASIRSLEVYDRPFITDLGTYRVVNRKSGKVLNSPGGSAQGSALDQSTDTETDNQWWKLVPATSGYYRLVNVGNGWCADVEDASTADGAAIIQWPDTGGTNQEWQVIAL